MKNIFLYLLCLFTLSSAFYSCKYDDGPLVSFRSKEARVINSWAYDLTLRNGLNVTTASVPGAINYVNSSLGFDDNGLFSLIEEIDADLNVYDGTWSFSDKKESLLLSYTDGNIPPRELFIRKLNHKKLWLEETIDDEIYQYELIPNK